MAHLLARSIFPNRVEFVEIDIELRPGDFITKSEGVCDCGIFSLMCRSNLTTRGRQIKWPLFHRQHQPINIRPFPPLPSESPVG
jgi:hypothetical protein